MYLVEELLVRIGIYNWSNRPAPAAAAAIPAKRRRCFRFEWRAFVSLSLTVVNLYGTTEGLEVTIALEKFIRYVAPFW